MGNAPSVIVFSCWFVFAVTWAIAALFVKRTVERRWSLGHPLMIVTAGVAYSIARRSPLGSTLLWTPTPVTEWLGAAIAVFGLWVTLWARFALGRNWSGTVTFKQDHELIERGPYRYVRHPIYSGILLMTFGTGVLHARAPVFAMCVILLVGFWFKLREEERLLTQHFPEAYPRYRQRVRALIPYVL